MKTTYKRETVLDKHNIKSCRAPAVKNDMKCCSFLVDSEKKIIRKYFLRQEILGIAKLFIWSHISCRQGFNLIDAAKRRKDARKKIINGRNSELINNDGTAKKFYVLQVPLHLMCPYRVRSLYPGLKAVRLTHRAQL